MQQRRRMRGGLTFFHAGNAELIHFMNLKVLLLTGH
jgi:hypothetical protein